MTDNAPRCQECGRRLEAWMVSDRDGLFCSQRCGYVWAVRTVRALLDAGDEPRWGKSIDGSCPYCCRTVNGDTCRPYEPSAP